MYLEIISPEGTFFTGEVEGITVPGTNGFFQVLKNHAPIVSTLSSGLVSIKGVFDSSRKIHSSFERKNNSTITFKIDSGTIEVKNNTIVLLCD